MRKLLFIFPFIFLTMPCFAQAPWSNILSSGRAIDWTHGGLPATYPDGETTPNPWTPPTRTQCGSTLSASGSAATDITNITNAVNACTAGHYVLLGPGAFQFNSAIFLLKSGVSLRGSGPMSTSLTMTGTGGSTFIDIGAAGGGPTCLWSSGLAAGSTTLEFTGCTGAPSVNSLAILQQCDSGFVGCGFGGMTNGSPVVSGSNFVTGGAWNGLNITINDSNTPDTPVSYTISSVSSSTSLTLTTNYFGPTAGAGSNAYGVGAPSDNGGLYICGYQIACKRGGEEYGAPQSQTQVEFITGVTSLGGGAYTVTVSTPIAMPNWSATNNPTASLPVTYYGIGLEDMTIVEVPAATTQQYGLYMNFNYGSWIKGIRIVGAAGTGPLNIENDKNCLTMSNYIHSQIALTSEYPVASQESSDSDNLFMNNITDSSVGYEGLGASSGLIFAYNYPIWVFTNQETTSIMDHTGGNSFRLYEGNISGGNTEDDTHGTHDLSVSFRNFYSGWYQPYATHPNKLIFNWGAGNRFTSAIGNVLGSSFITTYQLSDASGFSYVYGFDSNVSVGSDPLVLATNLRWANYDTVTAAVRYCGNSSSPGWSTTCASSSEIPTTLTGNAAFGNNLIPSTTALPCSFFLQGFTATSCAPFPSGGTGLNWWKVCTNWTTFPTSCAATQTSPFPPIGPDVIGGSTAASDFGTTPGVGGHANDIPASIAFKHLPIDTNYQSSYSITGSSWSGGTETLTISPAFGDVTHVIGALQISGGACATSGAGTPTGAEVYITNTVSTTSIQYARASNPGSCTGGTMLFPDVRQFDERVYQNDPLGVILSPSPESFGSVNVGSSSSPITFTLTNNTSTTATSISPSVSGGNSGDFAITNSGTGSCAAASGSIAASASCTFTVTFTPGAAGSRSTTLSVSYSGGDGASPQTSALSGTGNATGSVSLSPSSQNFGTVTVGASSATVSFTLSNTTASSVTSITVTNAGGNTADFVNTGGGTCSSTLAASSSCTIIMKFTPAAIGSRSTTLNVADSASSSPQQSSLSGTGIVSVTAPAAAIMAKLSVAASAHTLVPVLQ
jgi:hypothetical protein